MCFLLKSKKFFYTFIGESKNKINKVIIMNSWIILFFAGLFEISWAIGLKFSHGFSKLLPSVLTVIGMILSFIFLSMALKKLPLSIAYAVWTGIGIAGTSILGILIFHESVSFFKIFFVSLIVIGIIGLRLTQ